MPMADTDPRHASSGATLASSPPTSVTEVHTVVDPRLARRGLQGPAQAQSTPATTAAPLAPTTAEEPSGTSTGSMFAESPFQLEDSPSTAPQPNVPELACMPMDPRTGRNASATASAAVGSFGAAAAPTTLSDDQLITLPAPLYPESLFSSAMPPFNTSLVPTASAPTASQDATPTTAEDDIGPPTAAATPTAAAGPKQIRPAVPSTAPHPLDRDPDDPSLAPNPDDFTTRKITYSFQGSPLPCEALFTKATPDHVLEKIGDTISCDLQFNCSRRLALCILHVLNRGLPPFMRMRPVDEHAARTTFDATFERILSTERDPPLPVTCVAEGCEAFEILFVPMHDLVSTKGADGKWSFKKVPCFWCYRVVPGALAAAIKWLTMNRLPVVLDLDDTLVVANGEGALRDKRDKAKLAITKLQKVLEAAKKEEKDDSDTSSSGAAAPIQKKISILTKEVAILEQDMKMVREYIEDDLVTDENGDVHVAQMEAAFTEPTGSGGEIERPVIRLMRGEDYVTVFTRIDPENANTSMIIRVRAGWEKLKQELMATLDSSGLRKWDTYVCTAAEMRYALEVCRILDPEGDVFNRASLHHHLVCVSRANKKSLKAALHHPLDANRYKADASELEDPDDVDQDVGVQEDDQGPLGVPTMSVAIIVDDRIDVWESGVREQIVVASQFNHYPTAAAHACGEGIGTSRRGHNEVARILNFLTGIRRDLFHFWDNCLNPTVRQLLVRGVPNALYITEMHEMMAASPYVNVKSMLPSTALPLPPDSMGSRENQDSQTFAPVDPRKRRELAAQNAAAAAQANPPQNFTLTSLQPPQGAPPTAVISLQPVLRGARSGTEALQVFPPRLPPPPLNAQMPSPGPVPFISAASLPSVPPQPPSATLQLTPGGLALQPAPTFSAVPQDPRRARNSNSSETAVSSGGALAAGAPMNALPPPAPLAPGAPPAHINTSLMPLPPPGPFLGAQAKPQSSDGVPGLQGATDGVTKQEEKVKSEHTDSDMKLISEGKGSIDESMELLYSGGEVKPASGAEAATEVKEEAKEDSRKGEKEEGGELDDGEIEGSDDENGQQGGDKAASKSERESSADAPGTRGREGGGGGDRGARRKEEASFWEEDSWWGWDDEDDGHWSHNQGPTQPPSAVAASGGRRAAAPPADDEESKQRLQEKLWTLGQGGLPFVVVGQDTARNCFRPLKVQQNPAIASWAPFLKKGDVVPAIAVDPDPTKRPECIVIRIDGSMVNQTCALNQNYHFLLSDQMQSKYTFTGAQKTHTLPPWVLLDLDSQRHAVTDLHASFQQQHAPMPALNSNDIIHRAMGEWYSFYLRKPFPDIPSGGSVDLSAAESTNKTPAMTTAAANECISQLMRAQLSPGNGFRPINLPQDVIQQMVDNESAAADGWFEVGGPEGKQTVAVLHLPVGQEEDMTVQHALAQTPVSASERPFNAQQGRAGERPGAPGKVPAREGSPSVGRQAAAGKRKRGAPGDPGADADLSGPPGPGAGAPKAPRSAGRGGDEKSLLWCDQPAGANPISFLYEKGQAMQVAVEFQDRTVRSTDGNAGARVEMDVFWGDVQQPIGSASARIKKEAKRLAAIDALEYLDETVQARRPGGARGGAKKEERFAAWRDRKTKRDPAGYAGEEDWAGEAGDQEGGNSRRERDPKRTRLATDASTAAASAATTTGGYSSAIASLAAQALGTTGFAGIFAGLGKDVAGRSASTKGYGGSTGGYGAAKQAAAAKQGKPSGAIGPVAPPVDKSSLWSSRLATGGYGGGYGGAAGGAGNDQGDEGKAAGPKGSSAVDVDDIAGKVRQNGGIEKKPEAKATKEPDSEEEDGEILSDEET